MYDKRTTLSDQVATEVRTHFPDKVYETVIPRNVRISEAPSHGLPAIISDQNAAGSPVNLPADHPVVLTWMYLSPRAIGTGVGSTLMSKAIGQARADAVDVLWLTVWTSNQRAIPFYKRWGFRVAGMYAVAVGHSRPMAYIMAQTLNRIGSIQ